jgi:hypothetical protein
MFRRSQINELIDIVLNARFAQDRVRYDAAGDSEERETIGASGVVKMIRRLSPPCPSHILKRDCWISRNVFDKNRCQGSSPQVTHSAGTGADDKSYGFSLIKGRL